MKPTSTTQSHDRRQARRSPAWDPHQQGWKQATIRAQLPRRLARDAKAFGFRGEVWTTAQAAAVTERAFGVHVHPAMSVASCEPAPPGVHSAGQGVKKAQVGGGSIVWVDQSGFYLLLGEAPTHASDKIRVHYLGLHDLSLAPQDTLSLPDEDLELLIQFVKMRALEERLANETLAADPTSDLVTRLGHNARQAKEEFYRLLAQRQRATGSLVRWND